MAKQTVTLPSLGKDAGTKATVCFCYVKPGDKVAAGDNLIEMVTDKATFDVPAPAAGTIAEMLVDEDAVLHVGDPILILEI